jgi:hypothetical protein
MALPEEDRKLITKRIFGIAAATGIVTAAIGGYVAFRAAVAAANRSGGDTPVVLVGDSMIFRAGTSPWQTDSPTEYHVSPSYPVAAIAIKAKSNDDPDTPPSSDGDIQSDRLRFDISSGSTWEIDEFVQGSTQPVAALTPQGNAIYLDLKDTSGFLCPVNNAAGTAIKEVRYGHVSDCSDHIQFSSISLTISVSGQPQAQGTLNCIDQNNQPGICRIVFRGP